MREAHHVAPAEARQPLEPDAEHQDQQDADQEGGERHADQAEHHEQAGRHAAADAGIDAHRHAHQQRERGGGGGQFQGRGNALRQEVRDRPGQAVADAELPMQRGPHELGVLHEERLVEAELLHQRDPLRLRVVGAEHDGDGVAHEGEHGEGDQADDEDDGDGLQDAGGDEGGHLVLDPDRAGCGPGKWLERLRGRAKGFKNRRELLLQKDTRAC